MLKRVYRDQDVITAEEAETYAELYARIVQGIPGLRGVWSVLRHGSLSILTLIDADRKLERTLHEAELAFFDEAGDAPVQFQIYSDEESIRNRVDGLEPILSQS